MLFISAALKSENIWKFDLLKFKITVSILQILIWCSTAFVFYWKIYIHSAIKKQKLIFTLQKYEEFS